MNTTRLYEFLVLSKVLSYSKAAKYLYISQSVLSKHIQDMEREIGAPLFVRTTHGVELTKSGQLLKKEAQSLINKCDSVLRRLHSSNMNTKGTIQIAIGLEFSYSSFVRRF